MYFLFKVYLFEFESNRRTPAKERILIGRSLSLFDEDLIKNFKKTIGLKEGLIFYTTIIKAR